MQPSFGYAKSVHNCEGAQFTKTMKFCHKTYCQVQIWPLHQDIIDIIVNGELLTQLSTGRRRSKWLFFGLQKLVSETPHSQTFPVEMLLLSGRTLNANVSIVSRKELPMIAWSICMWTSWKINSTCIGWCVGCHCNNYFTAMMLWAPCTHDRFSCFYKSMGEYKGCA